MQELYIGLISGTSADGIDAAIVDFSGLEPKLVGTFFQEYTPEIREEVFAIYKPGTDEINRMGELDVKLGKAFASAVIALLKKEDISASAIKAIGSHGQTIRHHPNRQFTFQIGDPNVIAAETGIMTIADFRRRDIAFGGQGAPLVPAFHQAIFSAKNINRVVANIGGIANVTLLPSDGEICGFDTGPGNGLLDMWIQKHLQKNYDKNGEWAAQGKVNQKLLEAMMSDSYFKLSAPKSTGREYFNLEWLEKFSVDSISSVDVQATLVELTAKTLVDALPHSTKELFICGGGAHNDFLMSRIHANAKNISVDSTEKLGVHPDWVEAMAFAWLAKQTLEGKPGNIPKVTGARNATILGAIFSV